MTAPNNDSEATARQIVASALNAAENVHSRHARARRIVEDWIARGGRFFPPRERHHWAIWLMAQRLFEWSEYDRDRRCAGPCRGPIHPRPPDKSDDSSESDGPTFCRLSVCVGYDDPAHEQCARSLVFPFLHSDEIGRPERPSAWNVNRAAAAIVRGVAVSVTRKGTPASFRVKPSAVRKVVNKFGDKL